MSCDPAGGDSRGSTEEVRFFSLLRSFCALKHSENLSLLRVTNCKASGELKDVHVHSVFSSSC